MLRAQEIIQAVLDEDWDNARKLCVQYGKMPASP